MFFARAVDTLRDVSWIDQSLIWIALAATLAFLTARLPLQNLLVATALIGFGIIGTHAFLDSLRAPLATGGQPLRDLLARAGMGVAGVLICRELARLVLLPWRRHAGYGYLLLAVASVGAACLGSAWESYAGQTNASKALQPVAWQAARGSSTVLMFLGWLFAALVAQILATPWLLNKRPPRASNPDVG